MDAKMPPSTSPKNAAPDADNIQCPAEHLAGARARCLQYDLHEHFSGGDVWNRHRPNVRPR